MRISINISNLTNVLLDEMSRITNLSRGRIIDLVMSGDDFDDIFFVFEVQYPINPDSDVMAFPHYHGVIRQGLQSMGRFVRKTEENLQLASCTLDYSDAIDIANNIK